MRIYRHISRQEDSDSAQATGASHISAGTVDAERTVLARVEFLTEVMGDILNHVGGDPDALRAKLEGKAGGSGGGTGGDQGPSKAED